MSAQDFGKQIAQIRKDEALTQMEASKAWGVNHRTLVSWENAQAVPSDFFAKCILFYLRNRPKKRL